MNTDDAPDGIRKVVQALVGRAVQRCHAEGVPLEAFRAALLEEQRTHQPTNAADLIRRAFRRVTEGVPVVGRAGP